MSASIHLCLSPGVSVERAEGEPSSVGRGELSIASDTAVADQLLDRLAGDGDSLENLTDWAHTEHGYPALKTFYAFLLELAKACLIGHRLVTDSGVLAESVPIAPGNRLDVVSAPEGGSLLLSRFALLRRDSSRWILESPRSRARLAIFDPGAVTLVGKLSQPQSPESLAGSDRLLIDLLWSGGFLTRQTEDATREDDDPRFRQWEFHDLLFHSRTRRGRHNDPYGGTFRLRDVVPPAPARKKDAPEHSIELGRPDLQELAASDPPLTEVIERRRSLREQGSTPLNLDQLGVFLFRSARVQRWVGGEREITERVYPAGGAAYELEIYPLIRQCTGVEPGLYHYCPFDHALGPVSEPSEETAALLASAGRTALADEPQVLLVITARYRRVFWKYASVGYATILKDLGVLYQNMYLAGTVMNLAVCALGGGDADLFARVSGLDYYDESSVGEFALGAVPDPEPG